MASAAAAVRNRAHPLVSRVPFFLTWRGLGCRSICSGRLGLALPSTPPAVPGEKVLEVFTEDFEVGSQKIKLETGLMARFANGSVVFSMGDTHVLSTVACGKGDGATRDFLPLTVEYQERQYAQGIIPTSFMRREGAPRERELLCGRLIDRPIRPLFPSGFYHEVQIMINILASDRTQDPDVMAANATSAALMLSDIPWNGPIGVIRLGRVDGQFVVNPSVHELSLSDLNLVYACTRDRTLMIDVQACEISEKDLEAGLRLAHPEAVKYIDPQIRLAQKAGKKKKEYQLSMITQRTLEKVKSLTEQPIEAVFTDPSYGKFERGEALDKITQNAKAKLEENCDEESLKVLSRVVDNVRKKIVRNNVIEKGLRVDGRGLHEIRPLYCKSHKFPVLHGSALFSRGDTQVLCTVTLGTPGDAQPLDSLVGPNSKRFMLHYNFPPFSINEVGKRGGLNRREVGHGNLAEKALLPVLPSEEDFPYTVRVNSDVMASDGSTSMATVCGGSLALMDAGIPVKEHVAGVSVGLVTEVDPSTGVVKDYRILTDILGLEDHLGDMDFKIAGTRNGVTAIQLDIKPAGIPLDIVCESLYHAKMARMPILDRMEQEIRIPRTQDDINSLRSLRLATLRYSNDNMWRYLAPFQRKKIEKETGARIFVGDGAITIIAKDQNSMDKTQKKIDFIIGREIEVGGIYKGIVTSVKEYGAFVELNGGQQGLVHISELSHKQVYKVSDVVSVGEELSVKCIERDLRGNMKLSLKALQPMHGPEEPEEAHVDITSNQEHSAFVGNATNCTKIEELESIDSECEMDPVSYSTPSFVIRSADDSDVPEISSNSHESQKGKSNIKCSLSKKFASQKSSKDLSVFSGSIPGKKVASSLCNGKKRLDREFECNGGNQEAVSISKSTQTDACGETKISTTSAHPKSLKLGDKLTATVHQIRSGGLVLDLDGVRGMYRFEVNGRRDFTIGMKVRVKCSSFNQKGIPIMSLLE